MEEDILKAAATTNDGSHIDEEEGDDIYEHCNCQDDDDGYDVC